MLPTTCYRYAVRCFACTASRAGRKIVIRPRRATEGGASLGVLDASIWCDHRAVVLFLNVHPAGDQALRELPSPGKSGSVFFISHDERFFHQDDAHGGG